MKQKIFLTGALAMGFVAPAMAETSHTGTFPSGGLMQEDYTYTNAATSTNMAGVYEDGATVDAVAEYTDILYNIVAGNYLEAGSDATNGTQCPAGSWCPGLTNALYNETTDQGINSCSTATNGIYALSAAGASSQNDCYRECTTADVEHSAGVTGGYYYGNNNQCGATSCVNGWHLKTSMSGSELATTIGRGAGTSRANIRHDGLFSESGASHGQSYYGINGANTWALDYGANGMLIGQARCSTQSGQGVWNYSTNSAQTPTITSNLTDETGQEGAQYCYCNVTGYTPNGGTLQAVSSSWVFSYDHGGAVGCSESCASQCAYSMTGTGVNLLAFRAALLGAVQSSPAMCEANVININWSDVDEATAGQNNEGTAVYGEDVRTPVKAQTKKGKTFKGWRFSKPEQTTTGNNG